MEELEAKRLVARADRATKCLNNKDIQGILDEIRTETLKEMERIPDDDIDHLRALKIRLSGLQKITSTLQKWVNDGKRGAHALEEIRRVTHGTD